MPPERDPRTNPQPGDRWRDSWGTRTVEIAHPNGSVSMSDGETYTREDFRWYTAPSRWTFVEVDRV